MGEPVDPIAALRGKSWAELEAIEAADGRLLFADSIKRKRKDGTLEEVPIKLRVLRKDERRKARAEARKWAEKEGLDTERDAKLFDDLDTVCILARAIRDSKEPHDQHMMAEELERSYDMRSLEELWSRYQVYEDLTDPRVNVLDDATFWAAVGACCRARNILPLTALGSLAQNDCILRMGEEALTSPSFKSFYSAFESSTPAP
jgi:hypothetical protein